MEGNLNSFVLNEGVGVEIFSVNIWLNVKLV